MLVPGSEVGRYVVTAHINSSPHASVYRARDSALDRDVALKVMPAAGPWARRELEATGHLTHPNIVPILDVFEVDRQLCFVRPWVDGESLGERLDRIGPLPINEVLGLTKDLTSALAHAHSSGILHRDIKPSNVLRDRSGRYLLIDFGALGRLESSTGRTSSGQIAGTPIWMSPEQATGGRQGPAADVFGLGLLLFRCVYGYLPDEAAGNLFNVLQSRATRQIEVPDSPLRELIVDCLQLDDDRRPQVLEIRRWVDRFDVPPAPGTSVTSAPISGEHLAPPAAGGAPSRSGGRALIAVVLVLAAGAIAVASLISVGGSSSEERVWPLAASQILLGVGIAVGAIVLARALRHRWEAPSPATEHRASELLFGTAARKDLTQSLMIEVDQLLGALQAVDSRILGVTVVAMINEYETSRESGDRQAALLHVVELMEKIQTRLAPWHVRHRDAITVSIAIVGCLTGVLSAVTAVVR